MYNLQKNADRFIGFADTYNNSRPSCPSFVKETAIKYLGHAPSVVVDLGCGTGLSTMIWADTAKTVIGIEPSSDMINTAKSNCTSPCITFKQGFSHDTTLDDSSVDIITCSQSFHWMEPVSTLNEVNRILKPNGVFLTYDADWPPVCNWHAEKAFAALLEKVHDLEKNNPTINDTFIRFEKQYHLENIQKSGHFQYVREIVFTNRETFTAQRLINLAFSQGDLQTILKLIPDQIEPAIKQFENKIQQIYGNETFTGDFCYRMRVGIK